jgi:hypothetical protein
MVCREIELLIQLHIDGAITNDEAGILKKHLEVCRACASELALQERLSRSLREIGREDLEAPPEFCGLVMANLQAERRKSLTCLPLAWRRAIAAAAALLLLAGGSAGVTAGLRMAGVGSVVASNPAQTAGVEPGTTGGNIMPDTGDNQPGKEETNNPVSVPNMEIAFNDTANNSGNEAGHTATENISSETNPILSSAPSETVPLSGGVKVTSTFLKVAVADLKEARAKAVALADGAGVSTQVFPEQSGGKNIVLIRITVAPDRAPALIEDLTELGTLVDRYIESNDFTFQYNDTLVQYMELQSSLNAAQDAGEQEQLATQAASYKQQLDAWNAEAGKRIITLWLESK